MDATSTLRPHANPVLGSEFVLRRSPVDMYERAMRENGDVVRLLVGPPGRQFDLYCVFHPDGVRQVLAGPRLVYSKRNQFYEQIAAAFGWGLLTSEGERWERQRRLLQPLFTRARVALHADSIAEEAVSLGERWARRVTVDAHAEALRLSVRVAGRTLFDQDLDWAAEPLGRAYPVVSRYTFRRAMASVASPRLRPAPAAVAQARDSMYAVIDAVMEGGRDGDGVVARLLAARDPDTGAALSTQEVRDQALILLLMAVETTSTALPFALHLLGRHQDEQARLRDEIDRALGGRPPAARDLPALERTTMAVKEAMRLYPPVHVLGRVQHVEQEVGGHRIPAGAFVAVSQWATHRHPRFWPDPERFDPGRFCAAAEAARHPYAYFPFGRGPRACIGIHLAMIEAVTAVAAVLRRCVITAGPETPAFDTDGITLRPSGPVPLRVAAR
jgi:cytochrome P450